VLILLRKSQCASLSVVYRSLLALLAGVTVVGTASARVSQPEPSFVIQGDNKIGYFAVKRDGTLFGAQQAFGDPTSIVRGRYQNCRVGWRSASLSIQFYNLGGEDACEPQYGYLSQAIMAGRQWRTSKGCVLGTRAGTSFVISPAPARRLQGRGGGSSFGEAPMATTRSTVGSRQKSSEDGLSLFASITPPAATSANLGERPKAARIRAPAR
jgi:hypothetical protein